MRRLGHRLAAGVYPMERGSRGATTTSAERAVSLNGHRISARLREMAHHLIPGGCHTYAKGDDQYPILAPGFIARGLGCRVWDTDGRAYIEYGMGNRAVGLGHAYPAVVDAAQRELVRGGNFTRPSPLEVACAERVPGADRRRRDGQVLQGRLRCDLGRGAPRPRLYRARHDRVLRRPPVLLDRRLVHRHHGDERRHPAGRPPADRDLPLRRSRQRRGAVRARTPGASPR